MANRRMFSKRIISSARFMKLTRDAQILYFHLCMNADDDGAVEGYPVRRAIGVEEDAYANLEGRGFIKTLDRDNEVVYITDWMEHNRIRADRIQPSMYRELIAATVEQPILIEPRKRSDLKGSKTIVDVSAGTEPAGQSTDSPRTDAGQSTDGQTSGNGQAMDGLGEVRLSKVRLEGEREGEEKGADAPSRPKGFMRPTVQEIRDYCSEKGYLHVDAEYFWNYYENIGWKVGKNKMKSWRLAVANWDKRQKEFHHSKEQTSIINHTAEENAESWGW